VRALSRVFRGKYLDALAQAYRDQQLRLGGSVAALADGAAFQLLLRQLRDQDWVVYAKRPLAGPEQVLAYLGRYTHRVAISNHLSVVIIHPSTGADITSGGLAPLVAVMKSTDAGQCDDLGRGRRSRRDRSPVRCVLG
jgi:hypothetical protein